MEQTAFVLILLIIITISAIVIIKIKTNAKLVASKVHLLDEELKNKKNELTNMAIYYYELKKMVANLYVKLKQINYHCKEYGNQTIFSRCLYLYGSKLHIGRN